jgi:hypothetical protein
VHWQVLSVPVSQSEQAPLAPAALRNAFKDVVASMDNVTVEFDTPVSGKLIQFLNSKKLTIRSILCEGYISY